MIVVVEDSEYREVNNMIDTLWIVEDRDMHAFIYIEERREVASRCSRSSTVFISFPPETMPPELLSGFVFENNNNKIIGTSLHLVWPPESVTMCIPLPLFLPLL